MKILVTGAKGQLGYDVIKELNKRKIECLGVDKEDFDITDKTATMSFIELYRPSSVIHCAAYNLVDKAEEEKELCLKVNTDGTINVAEACRLCNAKMLHISTDYVFDGKKEGLYEPYDTVNPLSVYGISKAKSEQGVQKVLEKYFIVRTSWLFGSSGQNFVKKMLMLSRMNKKINVVDDQVGSPTYTVDLAPLLVDIALSEKYGIFHATNEGFCSWADFAKAIFEFANIKCDVHRISGAEYPAKAVRPKNCRLSKSKLSEAGFDNLPPWEEALKRYLKSEGFCMK
ncbi:MAG TPA: dTDP-4-dehydrorhamnose reductase [Defluviitaleaceae bacterium]|jgi:dTDP-4-dehydrorhamnose reductase|nr:dTDP-4-dehydrorhamnose reductase [Defluviitaleaceae bacterium]